jgi:hypothetical protein
MGHMEKSKEKIDGFSVWSDKKGYKVIWVDGKSIKVHVYVWEKENGPKPLGFDIHHKDYDKGNYKIENLELLSKSDHQKIHAGWLKVDGRWHSKPCAGCGVIKNLCHFYVRKGYTPSALCKPCHCKKTSLWAENNKKRRKEIALAYYYRKKEVRTNG